MKLSQTGAGAVAVSRRLRPGSTGQLFLQVDAPLDGLTSWSLQARAAPDAPWAEVIAANTADHGALIDWRPELQLTITAGTGTVTAWIAEAVE